MIKEHDIIDLIRSKDTQIPTLPFMVDKILSVTSSANTSARDLADSILQDQAIANKTLRLANSAYYGFAREIDTIQRAVAMIGFDEIVSLVLGISVFSTFQQKSTHGLLDMQDLWIHAIGCTAAAKKITGKKNININEQLFLAGLLHDMGKVIFAIYFPEEYRAVLGRTANEQIPLCSAEKEVFGMDHAELGGLLTERWNFPDTILMPVRYHHDSAHCPLEHQEWAECIELADFLCHLAKIGSSGAPMVKKPMAVMKEAGLTLDDMKQLTEDLKKDRKSIDDFFRVIQ